MKKNEEDRERLADVNFFYGYWKDREHGLRQWRKLGGHGNIGDDILGRS